MDHITCREHARVDIIAVAVLADDEMNPTPKPAAKRARLLDLSAAHHVSQSALSAILNAVREYGVPAATSRQTYRRERRDVATVETIFGPLLQEVRVPTKDGPMSVWFQHPMAFLDRAAATSPGFCQYLGEVLDKNSNRLSIAVYNDEVDAGKELAARHGKKFEVLYWTVLEFLAQERQHEDFWFTITALRSDIRSKVDGGMSHILKLAIGLMYQAPHDWRRGVVLCGRLVFGSVQLMNQDERAHKGISCAFGAGGKLFCINCQNCYDFKFPRPASALPMVASTCLDRGRFVPHSNATIRSTLENLRETLNKQLWQQNIPEFPSQKISTTLRAPWAPGFRPAGTISCG